MTKIGFAQDVNWLRGRNVDTERSDMLEIGNGG
jgi:hypothetical protein